MFAFIGRIFIAVCAVSLLTASACAFVSVDGYFIAYEDCPAFKSVKKKTNPDNTRLTKKMAYKVIGKNKPNATHYQIKIDGLQPPARWVSVSCGKLLTDCNSSEPASSNPSVPKVPEYLLAISWQPAFCQTHQNKNECETQTGDRYDADHFTLHGLWPQPKGNDYCGVSNKNKELDKRKAWDRLPKLPITDETYGMLTKVMPGVASHLQRHEWYKHGSCYDDPPDTYFRESIALVKQLNGSPVRDLFAANIGKRITAGEIRKKFDEKFGQGAGSKVKIKCNAGMISELWINLRGVIEIDTDIADLMRNAKPAGGDCDGGKVDEVGF